MAEAGDPDAERTVVFICHHDAAHTGLVFHPALPRLAMEHMPKLHERADQSVPILYGVFLGPLLLALWGLTGRRPLRGVGAFFAAGAVAAMADIGARPVVPGANDNLSAVAVIVALAQALRERPPQGVRVILLSTGSEESFMEGMQAFGRRHFGALPRATTEFVCLECVGSPQLCVVEGEGMLRMRLYDERSREELAAAGAAAGVELRRGLRTVAATDGLIALRAGYRTCTLGGVDETKFPSNYHWPSDTPDNLSLGVGRGGAARLRGLRCRLSSATRCSELSGGPSNSGRSRIPSRVRHFEKLSSMASISSRMKRGERFTRDTTTPGTSPSSTSWSTRANVIVNS